MWEDVPAAAEAATMLPDGAGFATNLAAKAQRDMAKANPAPGPRPGEVAGEAAGLEAAKAVYLQEQAAKQAEQQAATQQAPATAMDGGAQPELPYKVLGSVQVGGSPGGEVTTVGPTGLKILQGQNQAEDNYLQRQEAHSANIAGAEGDKVVALRGAAQRQQESADRQTAMFAAKQAEAVKLGAEVEKAGNELASTKIDPERYWSNKSVGSKIAIGIGAFLSGLGSGMQGRAGENKVLDSLSKEIDRDVQSQIDAYNARAKNVDAKRSLYGQLIEKYGPERAEAVLADAHYKKAMLMVDAATASSNSEQAMARGDELRMEIEQQRAARLMKTVQKVPASAGTMKRVVQLPDGSKVLMNDKEMTDYSVKQQELGLKGGAKSGAIDTDTRFVAQKLIERNIPDLRSAMANYESAIAKHSPTQKEGVVRTIAEKALGQTAGAHASEAIYGKDATTSDQAWLGFVNQGIKLDAGSGVTGNELDRKRAEMIATSSPEARKAVMRAYAARAKAIEDTALQGISPEAAAAFQKRGQASAPAPAGPPPGATRRQ